jgi:hypothetical protein
VSKPIAPGEHSPERLDATLRYYKDSGFLDMSKEDGAKPVVRRTNSDPYGQAKYVTEKLLRFFQDCMVDDELTGHGPVGGVEAAMEVVFVAELFALNILNAANMPLDANKLQAARDAAARYYESARIRIG